LTSPCFILWCKEQGTWIPSLLNWRKWAPTHAEPLNSFDTHLPKPTSKPISLLTHSPVKTVSWKEEVKGFYLGQYALYNNIFDVIEFWEQRKERAGNNQDIKVKWRQSRQGWFKIEISIPQHFPLFLIFFKPWMPRHPSITPVHFTVHFRMSLEFASYSPWCLAVGWCHLPEDQGRTHLSNSCGPWGQGKANHFKFCECSFWCESEWIILLLLHCARRAHVPWCRELDTPSVLRSLD
jgi:hypothetical protein